MTAETPASKPAVAGCIVEITDEDENIAIAFVPVTTTTIINGSATTAATNTAEKP
jgi:hypothetical protein